MQSRVAEYGAFRLGIYPARVLEPEVPPTVRVPYTVYPPYALLLFVPFFEPFGKIQGRIVVEVLSLAALVALARYGRRLPGLRGSAAVGLGAVAALAISGNGNSLALGQFSLICAGAILMQIEMLERGRPFAAAGWWVVAMLKPQMALAFAGLFVVRREWRALVLAAGVLVAMSLGAFWWTDISPRRLVDYVTHLMTFGFSSGQTLSGGFHSALGVQAPLLIVGASLLGLVLLPLLVRWFLTRRGVVGARNVEPLFLAALFALPGRELMYHRFYDNVMMFPLLFALLEAACRRPSPASIASAALMGSSLWIPERLLDLIPFHEVLRPTAWAMCAVALVAGAGRTGGPGEGAVASPKPDVDPIGVDAHGAAISPPLGPA